MTPEFHTGAMCVLCSAFVSVFAFGTACGQGPGINSVKQTLVFSREDPPDRKELSFGGGELKSSYSQDGRCLIYGVNFLRPKYGYAFDTYFQGGSGDLVGLLGAVYRSRDFMENVFDRIPDMDVPKGAKVPAWDSITVPFTGGTGFGVIDSTNVGVSVLEITSVKPDAKPEKHATAVLEVKLTSPGAPAKRTTDTLEASIKAGDIVLIHNKGHVVRAVVPRDWKTRVIGWVELAPEPIPEADLIRDKKAFVQPKPNEEKKK